jgi:hypothetical protein
VAEIGNHGTRYRAIPYGTGVARKGSGEPESGSADSGSGRRTDRSARVAKSPSTAYRQYVRAYSVTAACALATYGFVEILIRK